jgi:hypothetical protein
MIDRMIVSSANALPQAALFLIRPKGYFTHLFAYLLITHRAAPLESGR